MAHGQPWTEEELKLLKRPGLTDRDVAAITGRTVPAVVSRRYDLNNPGVRRTAFKDWRRRNPSKRAQLKARNYALGALHQDNARRHWTQCDDDAITADDRPCDRVLAKRLQRTVRAIQIRRSRITRDAVATAAESAGELVTV